MWQPPKTWGQLLLVVRVGVFYLKNERVHNLSKLEKGLSPDWNLLFIVQLVWPPNTEFLPCVMLSSRFLLDFIHTFP